MEHDVDAALSAWFEEFSDDEANMAIALCRALDEKLGPEDIEVEGHSHYGLTVLSIGSREYAIGTDGEADEAWDKALDSYIDECILPEMPEHLQGYFDEEKWKRDAQADGRGHALSYYDGDEYEAEGADGVEYCIFQIR